MELSSVCISFRLNIIRHMFMPYTGDNTAEITINSGEILEGYLPSKALSMVREWIEINKEELLLIWNTQEFRNVKPLE